jgi:regulator of replication initiation timing
VGDNVEDIKRRLAGLSAEVEVLKLKYAMCVEAVVKLREELEGLKRRVRRTRNIREYIKALEAYEGVGAGEPEPP